MTTVNLSKSQIETIIVESLQDAAKAMANTLDVNPNDVDKAVTLMIKTDGEEIVNRIASNAMKRYRKT